MNWTYIFFKDVRYALRYFWRHPGLCAMVILTLALGVGTNTAIFTVINAVVLRSLPVPNPQELVILTNPNESGGWHGLSENQRDWISYQEFVDLRSTLTSLSGLCAVQATLEEWQVRLDDGLQEPVRGRLVSENYFSVFQVKPILGRFFNEQDGTGIGQDPYAVISYDFWQRRLGGQMSALKTRISLNGAVFTVIGIAAPGFRGESVGQSPDLWVPMMMQPTVYPGRDWLHEDPARSLDKMMWLHAFGRLKPGFSLARAQSEINVAFQGMMQAFYPPSLPPDLKRAALNQYLVVRDAHTGAFSGRDEITFQLRILLGVAGLVLLVACANVANLFLVRAMARQREVAVRLSIGASRMRLLSQFFIESFLLTGLGGVAGVFLAIATSPLLVQILSDPLRPLSLSVTLDWRVLAFTAAVTLAAGIFFGIVPALRVARTNINVSLRESGSNVTNARKRMSFAAALVIGQVALSLLLIVGAGLFLRTLWNMQKIVLGYPKEHLLQVRVDGVTPGYKDQTLQQFYRDVAERIRVLPGVGGVAYSRLGLLTGHDSVSEIKVDGFVVQYKEDSDAHTDAISAGYFSTLGIPLLLGRDIGEQDTTVSQKVCVINEELANHFFAGVNPIGRHISVPVQDTPQVLEIVGVAKSVRSNSLRLKIPPMFYRPVNQVLDGGVRSPVTFEVRTKADPKAILASVRKAILAVNPDAPITASYTMEEAFERRTLAENQISRLSLVFGLMALVLAAIGLYGVLSDGVARRTNEIGIRMALGAGRDKVVRLILGETGVLVAIGLAIGVIAVFLCTRLVETKLYGISTMDPSTIIVAFILLSVVAMIAAYLPATRAAGINPMRALRQD